MKKILLLIASCIFSITVQAQVPIPTDDNIDQTKPSDLMDVFAQALQSDPAFKQAEENLLAETQNIPITRSVLLPQIFSTANTAYNHATHDVQAIAPGSPTIKNRFNFNSQFYDVNLTQTLFDLNQWTTYQQSKTQVKASEASYAYVLQNLMARVARAYLAILLAEDTLRYTEAEKRAIYQNLEQVQEQYKVGLVAITGVYQAQASYDSVLSDEITALNGIVNARENLRAITGVYYTNIARLKSQVPFVTLQPKEVDGWVELSKKYNWNLQSARFTAEAAQQNIMIQRSQHLPTISAFADAQYTKTGRSPAGTLSNHDSLVGVQLDFPVFQGFLVTSLTKQAIYEYQSFLSQMEETYRTAINDTRQSYNNIKAGISKIKADQQTIISDKSAVESTAEGYKVGTQTIYDLLQQQQNLYDDQRQYAADQYDYINNLIALKLAAGTLKDSDLAEINTWLTKKNDSSYDVDHQTNVTKKTKKIK